MSRAIFDNIQIYAPGNDHHPPSFGGADGSAAAPCAAMHLRINVGRFPGVRCPVVHKGLIRKLTPVWVCVHVHLV